MKKIEELDSNEPTIRAGRDTESIISLGNTTFENYTDLWTYETEDMVIEEILTYVWDMGKEATAEDFLDRLDWVINSDEWTQEHRAYIERKINEVLETGIATPEYDKPVVESPFFCPRCPKCRNILSQKFASSRLVCLNCKREFTLKEVAH